MPGFATARAALPGQTRLLFGENISFLPYAQGKMAEGPDPSRQVMIGVRARFDADFELEQVGGGRDTGSRARAAGETTTVSVERRLLAWLPRLGDRVSRVHPVTGDPETFRIQRAAGIHGGILLYFLSPNP